MNRFKLSGQSWWKICLWSWGLAFSLYFSGYFLQRLGIMSVHEISSLIPGSLSAWYLAFASIGTVAGFQAIISERSDELEDEAPRSIFRATVINIAILILGFFMMLGLTWTITLSQNPFGEPGQVPIIDIFWFVIDQTLRGMVFDVFDVLNLPISKLTVEPGENWFLLILIVYRLFIVGASFKVVLRLFNSEVSRRPSS